MANEADVNSVIERNKLLATVRKPK